MTKYPTRQELTEQVKYLEQQLYVVVTQRDNLILAMANIRKDLLKQFKDYKVIPYTYKDSDYNAGLMKAATIVRKYFNQLIKV